MRIIEAFTKDMRQVAQILKWLFFSVLGGLALAIFIRALLGW